MAIIDKALQTVDYVSKPKSQRDWEAAEAEAAALLAQQNKDWIASHGAVPGTPKWFAMREKQEAESQARRKVKDIEAKIAELERPEFYNPPEDRGAVGIDRKGLRNFSGETGIYMTPEGGYSNIGSAEGMRPIDRPEGSMEHGRLTGLLGWDGKKGGKTTGEVGKRAELLMGGYTRQLDSLIKAKGELLGDDPRGAEIQAQIDATIVKMEALGRTPTAGRRSIEGKPWSLPPRGEALKRLREYGEEININPEEMATAAKSNPEKWTVVKRQLRPDQIQTIENLMGKTEPQPVVRATPGIAPADTPEFKPSPKLSKKESEDIRVAKKVSGIRKPIEIKTARRMEPKARIELNKLGYRMLLRDFNALMKKYRIEKHTDVYKKLNREFSYPSYHQGKGLR